MKRQITVLLFFLLNPSLLPAAPMNGEDICRRLLVTEDVYIMDVTGEHIVSKLEQHKLYRHGQPSGAKKKAAHVACTLSGGSGYRSSDLEEPLYFTHKWTISDDGKMTVLMTQYDRPQSARKSGEGVVKASEFPIKDMSALTWPSLTHKNQRVVVHLTPFLKDESVIKDLRQFPITGEDIMIADNKGNLWANNLSLAANYVGVVTVQGTILLSYYPFRNATKIGTARGNTIELQLPERGLVTLASKTPFLPGNLGANVYGLFDPNRKSEGLTSTSIMSSDLEDKFLENVTRK